MWRSLGELGVPSAAQVLEPGCGTGNFISRASPGDQVTGVELDPTTASIAQLLNPDTQIKNESFAQTVLDHDGYDAVIGNVPFGQVKLYDPAYNEQGLSLHNHFIVKSLRQTKPGGVVAVMSSRWTMDGKSERARREISQHGELLGAVRMPAGAHGEVAGTDVVIDVLVFRRHLGEAPATEPDWIRTLDVDGTAGPARMNSYFVDRPEQVLGDVGTRLGQFGPELTVITPSADAATVAPQLSAALSRVVSDAHTQGAMWAAADQRVTDRPVANIAQDPNRIIGRISVTEDGTISQLGLTGAEPVNAPKNAMQELRSLVEIRDASVTLLEQEARSAENSPQLVALRQDLNDAYDNYVAKYGPISRFTTHVRERAGKEPIVSRRYPAALRALRTDPHYATIAALEVFNEDTGRARKATVFNERVVGVTRFVERVERPEDAIAISLDRTGFVDVPLVAELLDIEEAAVPGTLGELVFLSPDDSGAYVPAAEFLSGNVRQKRAVARELAETDATYQRHVDALEHVIPDEVGPAEIDVKLGAAWVPTADVSEFLRLRLGKEVRAIERIDGEWKFKLRGKAAEHAQGKWAVAGDWVNVSAESVFKMVLNGDKLELRYKPDKDSPYLVDQVGTEALQERATELHENFQDWLWSDAERAVRLQERYNDLYNGIVLRSYDGVELSFPGKAATFTPRPHQHAAVARMIAEPAVGLFHEVGAGKTAEMVLGTAELRRLGLAQKPAIVVPNHMLDQFTREYKQIYPRARILSAGSETLSGKDGRKLFVARARTGDWDAVILTHSAFTRIGLGNAEAEYAKQRLSEMQEVHTEKLDSELSSRSVKKLEADLAKEEERLKKLLDIDHDEGVSWDETGIDYLCIDEAHVFKNLTVTSKVSDLSKADGSARAQDLDMKLWYHREHLGQTRVATLATATPLPNSMIEMFVMMRYLRPDLLKEAEVYAADDWARQFTEQVTAVEPKPQGGGYQVKNRTSKFRNTPELLRMWHVPGDVKTQADLKLPVPKLAVNSGVRAPEMVIVPANSWQEEGMAELIERGEAVRNGQVEPEEDNMLKITSNGRALALDARLMGYPAPGEGEPTKLEAVVDRVAGVWEANRDRTYLDDWGEPAPVTGALQLVFADLGTPSEKDDTAWDAYNHIRNELVARGIPREQVKFIHEAKNDKQKGDLFQQCRDGRVQVLIGSTEKMGVGTNVQQRAAALHHVDAPWRPSDVTQREGRIVRQLNQNSEVQVYRYATEGSFDAYMWGTLSRKAQFIEQVLSGRLDVREVDNSSEMALQFSEMQAVAAGDMRILEVANLRQDTQKLGRQERAHSRKIGAVQARRFVQEGVEQKLIHDIEVLRELEPKVTPTQGDAFAAQVRPNKWTESAVLRDRTHFGQALTQFMQLGRDQISYFGKHNASYPSPLKTTVTVAGLEWTPALRWNAVQNDDPIIEWQAASTHDVLKFEMRWSRLTGGEASSLSRQFERHATEMPELIQRNSTALQEVRESVASLRELEADTWPKKSELEHKRELLAELLGELEAEAQPAHLSANQEASAQHPESSVSHVPKM